MIRFCRFKKGVAAQMPEMPSGGPQHRDEEMYAYIGGAGAMPTGAPYNRWEEWMLWLAEIGSEAQPQIDGGTITLSATWSGAGPYTQTVTVSGASVTSKSEISLRPTPDQLAELIADGITALVIENNDGVLTATAIGGQTSAAMTIACTVTEVSA